MRDVFLAVDAGNTKTWAGLTTADGELVGLVRGGVGDIYAPAGAAAAKEVVLSLVDDVLDSAGLGPADVRHAAFRLAGVDWPVDSEFWTAALRPLFDVARLSIKNDGFALIRCGRLDGQASLSCWGPGPRWPAGVR